LLTGANSSGKSSLIYSILGIAQTLDFPLSYSPNGELFNMGGYGDMAINGDHSKNIEVRFRIIKGEEFSYHLILESKKNLPSIIHLGIDTSFANLSLKKQTDDYTLEISLIKNSKKFPLATLVKELENHGCKVTSNDKTSVTLTTLVKRANELTEWINPYSRVAEFLISFIEPLQVSFNINYISSYRLHPERTYYQKPTFYGSIKSNGEGYIDQLLYWHETSPDIFKSVINVLKKMSLLHTISSKEMEGGRVEFKVQVNAGGFSTSLADVGFGVSHFLPIIVADFQLHKSGTLIVSQPENDLHPSVQAKFGDYISNRAKNTTRQYIIETHSELLINRLRLNIVKGLLKSEDVAIYFLQNTNDGSKNFRITFTKDGQIHGAPKDFFETYMMDVMDIALNAEEE
jgi:predicted ATPase